MTLLVLGLNHRTAPLDLREKLTVEREQLDEALQRLHQYAGQGVILSTCNRLEVYAHEEEDPGLGPRLGNFLGALSGMGSGALQPHLYQREGIDCVRHLFRVASGLDSMVVGERQILGQVRAAFSVASERGSVRGHLSGLFHQALRSTRRVHRETNIGRHSRSVSQAGVHLARGLLGDLSQQKALVIGAGDAGRLVAQALADAGVRNITVANRTQWRAEELARELGGVAAPLEQLTGLVSDATVVISSTGSPGYVLTQAMLEEAVQNRRGQPLLLIDIAVPRDIDPRAGQLEGVQLYDIDALQMLGEASAETIRNDVRRAEDIVEQRTQEFRDWWDSLDVAPLISSIRDQADSLRREEIAKTLSRLRKEWPQDPEQLAVHLDAMTRSLLKKVLHQPTVFLKENRDPHFQQLARQLLDLDGGTRRRGRGFAPPKHGQDNPAQEPGA